MFLEGLENEVDGPFSGTFDMTRSRKTGKKCLRICPGEAPAAAVWELPHSEVGFLELYLTVEEDCVMDVLNTDALSEKGHVEGNTYAARYVLKAGKYHLISFEPRLIRYVKCIFRTRGKVEIACPAVLEDTYPDDHTAYFSCDDGDLNRIYEASRRTLRLNMLDLFMDCPQRERGGWLCDSYFSARGAWQMFGDLRVEKDFLENFLLTDADHMWQGFFPEVYPGVRGKGEIRDVGIRNWSFWLMLELCDYCDRSGDGQFAKKHRGRVERFVEGLLGLRGEHGLLEKDAGPFFVDWSLANQPFALEPVSIPINCLAVFMLKRLAGLYQKEEWYQAAEKMEEAVSRLTQEKAFGQSGCETEGGVALELWSGFHGDDREYIRRFVDSMGSCPKYRPDPNIGKANLFIGLMLRFDVLARMGRADVLVREWKDLYLEELQNGAGTLFESIQERSGCHGFNGYVGALMTNQILGLGIPMQSTKTVMISPHPGELNWACGNAVCEEGNIYFKWSADHENHIFDMTLYLPKGWEARYELPFELSGWSIRLNGKVFQES